MNCYTPLQKSINQLMLNNKGIFPNSVLANKEICREELISLIYFVVVIIG